MYRSRLVGIGLGALLVVVFASVSWGHFGMIIPADDIVEMQDPRTIDLSVYFAHPMEGDYMDMVRPQRFGVYYRGAVEDLLPTLKRAEKSGLEHEDAPTFWTTQFPVKRPGDYTFFVEPAPYWEPAEDSYIVHYTKVCVHALGMEVGWDAQLGLETEIVPLTRPYGLWTGNLFTGLVLFEGEPVPFAEVEVEYYNESGKVSPPAGPYITQVVQADESGVFSYAMPLAGWWGFAALHEASWTLLDPGGVHKPVEIGAVYWVRTRDMGGADR